MKPKKAALRLQRRRKAHAEMMARGSRESKVQDRMDSGGYKEPGSYKR